MVDTMKLRGLMAEHGYTQQKLAKELGISKKTVTTRLKTGVFRSDELEKLIKIFNLQDPASIFFSQDVTQ